MAQLTQSKDWIVINATASSNERDIGKLSTPEKDLGCLQLARIPKNVFCG
jgi:hypothetical protein